MSTLFLVHNKKTWAWLARLVIRINKDGAKNWNSLLCSRVMDCVVKYLGSATCSWLMIYMANIKAIGYVISEDCTLKSVSLVLNVSQTLYKISVLHTHTHTHTLGCSARWEAIWEPTDRQPPPDPGGLPRHSWADGGEGKGGGGGGGRSGEKEKKKHEGKIGQCNFLDGSVLWLLWGVA